MSEKTSVGVGFSPRVYPRPKYISLFDTLVQILRSVVFQSGVIGTIITILIYPFYIQFMTWLKNNLGDYGNDAMLVTIVLSISHTATYILVNGIFGSFDYFQLFQEYKLARKPYMNPKKELIFKCLLEALIGQLILNPLGTYYLLYPGFTKSGMSEVFSPLPTNFELFRGYCVANLFNGVTFYFAHRLFHSKLLYPIFHKQHHEFNGTMGIAAEYANPIEQIFANMIPSLLGLIFFPTHPLCVAIWLALRLQQTYEAHSGYCFKNTIYDMLWLSHADEVIHHDYHHTVNTGNFGTEYMDWLFGTEDGFMASGGVEGYLAKKKIQKNTTKSEAK